MPNNPVSVQDARRAIHDWIRDDAPLTVKMALMPEHVTALIDRLAALRSDPARVAEEMREALRRAENDFYEVANQLGGYVDVMTPQREAEFMLRLERHAAGYGEKVRAALRADPLLRETGESDAEA